MKLTTVSAKHGRKIVCDVALLAWLDRKVANVNRDMAALLKCKNTYRCIVDHLKETYGVSEEQASDAWHTCLGYGLDRMITLSYIQKSLGSEEEQRECAYMIEGQHPRKCTIKAISSALPYCPRHKYLGPAKARKQAEI